MNARNGSPGRQAEPGSERIPSTGAQAGGRRGEEQA